MKHKVPMRKTAFQAETIRIGSRQIDAIKSTCMNGQAESSRVCLFWRPSLSMSKFSKFYNLILL